MTASSDGMPGPASTGVPGGDTLVRTAAALAVLAALFAAWAGRSWYAAAHDASHAYSRTREDVLQSGEQAIQNLNTLDYRALGPGLKSWQDSTTSDLYQQITQGRAGFEEQVRKARTITSARILEGAVAELDERSGRARVLVAVRITVTPPDGKPVTKQNRLVGELTRTGAGWKLSALGQAPTGSL
ncbi:hypothetical protein [Actinomadura fibrosa]|uniref:Mce-associated membrane protein n=1 Tax=Actinomadura fibrosa TaxID=111802 RepID=A0ABW2XIM0_9ACTN|nr:hypothetical protein [Actinomadura fibrosa]